jgi:hypothetical protein
MTSGLGLADNVLNMMIVDYARLGGQHMDKWILCAGCQHREQPRVSPVHMRAVRWNVALSEMYCLATTASCNKKRHGLSSLPILQALDHDSAALPCLLAARGKQGSSIDFAMFTSSYSQRSKPLQRLSEQL